MKGEYMKNFKKITEENFEQFIEECEYKKDE